MSDQISLFQSGDQPPDTSTAGGRRSRPSKLIEASAGTGKTHTLTNLAADYLAAGEVAISQLLMVTYTRAAAGELRDRLRRLLRERLDQATDDIERARLRAAIEDFDTASVTTIHGFCQQVLTTLGVNVPLDPATRLLADDETLIGQVAADLLAAEAIADFDQLEVDKEVPAPNNLNEDDDATSSKDTDPARGALPKLDRLTGAIAKAASHPRMALAGHPDTADANRLAQLTAAGVAELNRRLAQRSQLTYQHLLDRVADAVGGPSGRGVVDLLRSRFKVALIDEFQDTDPVQWEIFRSLFVGTSGPASPTLVLVGDPKQAIYSFRGADIGTYLAAAAEMGDPERLGTNWRSTPQLVGALNSLFAGATFGTVPGSEGDDLGPSIGYDDVVAAQRDVLEASTTSLSGAALRFRCFDIPAYERDHPPVPTPTGKAGTTPAGLIKHFVALDLVQQVHSTLTEGVPAEDITVLVTSNRDAHRLQTMLAEAGVRAVLGRAGSVVDSPAAQQIRRLLWAMERPSAALRVRAVALGWFFGYSAEQVATMVGDDSRADINEELAAVQDALRDDAEILRRRGVAELAHRLRCRIAGDSEAGRPSTLGTRLLATPGGERHLTDLAHLWELLSDRTGAHGVSPSSVLEALTESVNPEQEATEVLQRRTEADGGAVTVMTVHVSKGLENRVVMVPYMWGKPMNLRKPVVGHLPGEPAPVLAVDSTTKSDVHTSAQAALQAEGDRLLYVALTRARERLVVWAAPGAHSSERSRLMTLLARRSGQEKLVDLDMFRTAVDAVSAECEPNQVSIDNFVIAEPGVRFDEPVAPGDGRRQALATAAWTRPSELMRRRWSFSALTADHDVAARPATAQTSEDATGRGDLGADDEGPSAKGPLDEKSLADAPVPGDPPTVRDPWVDLGAGTAFGTLVHEVLEEADLEAPDLEAELSRAIAAGSPPDELDQPRLASAVASSVLTPMGGSLGSLTLAGLARADQLRELDFDLPLEGAVRPTGADLTRLVDAWLPADDPLAGRTFTLGAAASLPLAGMLTGSIDLTIRARCSDGGPDRYVVADYKTNLLAPWGTSDPEAAHPDRLVDAMVAHDYPLQALLYEVALHRYLRWRLPAYDPEAHLGGAAYLFLRGMTGPDTPVTPDGRTYGVFTWQPPTGLILALSDLLAGAELDEVTP